MLLNMPDIQNLYMLTPADTDDVTKILSAIDNALNHKDNILIAIEGRCCSGKTTLSEKLKNIYHSIVIYHTDDFFLPPERKTPKRLAERGGNIDYEALKHLITSIKSGVAFEYKKYDCHSLSYTTHISSPASINVIEGVYSMHPTLIDEYDLILYLDIDKQTQLKRLVSRTKDKVILNKYLNEWIPLENIYFGE